MKNCFSSFALLLSAVVSLSSCRESSKLPAPKYDSVPIIIPVINPSRSYFNLDSSRVSDANAASRNIKRPIFEFVVNPSQGYGDIQTVEVYKSFRRGSAFGPRVKLTDLTSFPATITLNSQDALTGLYLNSPIVGQTAPLPVKGQNATAVNRLVFPALPVKDAVVFTFEYIMKDGRRIILTPLSNAEGSVNAIVTNSFVNAPLAAIAEFR